MKIDGRRAEAFLRDPGHFRVALLFGDDLGLIRERAAMLVKAVAGATDDPFRVTDVSRDAVARLAAEVESLPLAGGRRVVRVREAGDTLCSAVRGLLAGGGPGFLILEAPGLDSRSKLRALVEASPNAAVVACYVPNRAALSETIKSYIHSEGVTADADAIQWLEERLGVDREVTRSELEKLLLYVGHDRHVDLHSVGACIGDRAGLSLDDALFAATAGDLDGADRALMTAFDEGVAPIRVLRGALGHLQRLDRTQLAVEGGMGAIEATSAARPPVFFQRKQSFMRALMAWTSRSLETASVRSFEGERACKRAASPAEMICRNFVLGIARRGAAALRREGFGQSRVNNVTRPSS